MKQKIKILMVITFALCSATIRGQEIEQQKQLMQNINASLSQGDCDRAQRNYNAWKEFTKSVDSSIEYRIATCKGEKNDSVIVQPPLSKIQQADSVEVPVATPQTVTPSVSKMEIPDNATIRRQEPVNRTNSNASKQQALPKKHRFLLMPGIAVGNAFTYSITVGYLPRKFGGYIKCKSNLVFTEMIMQTQASDNFYVDNFAKRERHTIAGGMLAQVTNNLLVYCGVGYGSKHVQWKTLFGQLETIDDLSFEGVEPEAGLMLKAGNFIVGAGVSVLIGKQIVPEGNISLGLIF
jgi:predicted membrane protein